MSLNAFLAAKNIEFSLRRYAIDALNYMTLGLFGSLIIGLILKTVGGWLDWSFLIETGTLAQNSMGAAIGVAVAYGLQAPAIVIFASAAIGAFALTTGGPVGAFVAVMVAAEMSKLVSKTTPLDIILTPATALVTGLLTAHWIAPILGNVLIATGQMIQWAMGLQPFLMSILIAVSMGMILTGPTSSAALAISLNLRGDRRLRRADDRLCGDERARKRHLGPAQPGPWYQHAATAQYRAQPAHLDPADPQRRDFRPHCHPGFCDGKPPQRRGHGHQRLCRPGRHPGRDGE